MTKRMLSMVLSLALLLSCVSGITLFTAAEESELPTPITWITVDQETGAVTASRAVVSSSDQEALDPYTSTAIPGDNGYGIRLWNEKLGKSDWQGFWIGSDDLKASTADSVSILVEYYIDSSVKTNEQLLRIMPSQFYNEAGEKQAAEQWIDFFTEGARSDLTTDVLKLDQTALLVYTYSAAQWNAIREDGGMAIGFKGCEGSNGGAYIKSIKFVDSRYVNTATAYACYDFEGRVVTDYYPDIKVADARDMGTHLEATNFRHFSVFGAAAATDNTVNKPVYIKMYTKAGYENTTITLQQFEAYTPGGRWACDNGYAQPVIQVENGVGAVMLAETSFTNANNGGSFRVPYADGEKIARVEVYDVTTYCSEATATDEMKALFHEYKMNRNDGVTTVVNATGTKITCDACGEVLLENTSALPLPYAFMDANSATLSTNFLVNVQGGQGTTTPVQIPGTEEYGLPLNADWSGFNLSGKLLGGVPEGQSVTMVVEYYITKDFIFTDRHQLFRYQVHSGWEGGNGNPAWYDMFTDTDVLVHDQSALFIYTFTAEDIAAVKDNEFAFAVLGCSPGAGEVYIQSMKLVNTEYVHPVPSENPYAYVDYSGRVVCDYYEDIVLSDAYNMHSEVLEVTADFAGYTYLNVYGPAAGGENNLNKPIVLKLYASKDNENATVTDVNIDVSDASGASTWHVMEPITFVDGEATVVIDACLKNRLNSAGSLRIGMDQIEKIDRIEVYDVATYCNDVNSSEELDWMHDLMLKNSMNTKKVGAKEATTEETGYTGDTVCVTCDTVLKYGVTIPVQDDSGLPTPYAQFDTAGGVLGAYGVDVLPVAIDNVVVEAIGATGEAGIKLSGDWKGIQMNGMSLATLAEGDGAALVIEYYLGSEGAADNRMFRYRINGGRHTDVFRGQLKMNQSGIVVHTFSAEELAAIGDSDFSVDILACDVAADIYVQSAKLINTDYLTVDTDEGYIYTEFEEKVVCDYYPDITAVNANGVKFLDLEQNKEEFPDTDWLYRYFMLNGAPLAANAATAKPVYIKIYTNEDNLNTSVHIHSYEITNGSNAGIFGDGFSVEIVDGVGSVLLPKACFTNGLNGIGSFRIFYTEVNKIARIEVYDVASYCATNNADEALVDTFHEALATNRLNVSIVGKVEPTTEAEGYSGDIYCATCNEKLADGNVLPKLEQSDLPDPYAVLETTNGVYALNGMVATPQGGSGNLTVLPIGSTGEYGIRLEADWSGFNLGGMFDAVPEGKGAVVAIEYFIDSDAVGQMLRYKLGAAAHVDIFTSSKECHTPTLILASLTAEEVAAAKADPSYVIAVLGCDPGKNVTYIQSVRVIDPQYVTTAEDLGYDYMSFEDVPLCEYYPNIVGRPSSGITLVQTHEGQDENGDILYGYFAVTQSLLKEGEAFCPVVLRLTFKEDCELTGFDWQHQCMAEAQPDHSEWSHNFNSIADGVVEVLIDEATFTNGLNGLGSFRLPNNAVQPVLNNLKEVRVMRLNDTSALKERISGADALLAGKTYASQEAYKAALADAQALLEDYWATEQAIADALAALEEAEALLEDCAHNGETTTEGYVEETCLIPGYTGDTVCADCGATLEEGEEIPAHETTIINVKEATCGEAGYTGDIYCVQCGKIVKGGEEIMSPPHTWDDGVVTKPAKPDARGEITITCEVCGSTKIKYFDFEAALGDVNEDGKTDSTDARLVLQFAVQKIAPSALNLDVADVDGDGKVDSTDARIILQYAVGKIQAFPADK